MKKYLEHFADFVPEKIREKMFELSESVKEEFIDSPYTACTVNDSRKALETYLSYQENTAKLHKAGVDIEAERVRLQDY